MIQIKYAFFALDLPTRSFRFFCASCFRTFNDDDNNEKEITFAQLSLEYSKTDINCICTTLNWCLENFDMSCRVYAPKQNWSLFIIAYPFVCWYSVRKSGAIPFNLIVWWTLKHLHLFYILVFSAFLLRRNDELLLCCLSVCCDKKRLSK